MKEKTKSNNTLIEILTMAKEGGDVVAFTRYLGKWIKTHSALLGNKTREESNADKSKLWRMFGEAGERARKRAIVKDCLCDACKDLQQNGGKA